MSDSLLEARRQFPGQDGDGDIWVIPEYRECIVHVRRRDDHSKTFSFTITGHCGWDDVVKKSFEGGLITEEEYFLEMI
jgi:hypothetical protein